MTWKRLWTSIKPHRELEVRPPTAWYLMQRIREAFNQGTPLPLPGPVEIDETYVGGKEHNKHRCKRLEAGRWGVGKTIVAGAKDRPTKHIRAAIITGTDRATLHGFVNQRTLPEAEICTDDAGYRGVHRKHQAVRHGVGEYVRGQVHTNGIESFWALFKRGFTGTYHKMSKKHLPRYVNEFVGRHNMRDLDTKQQMSAVARSLISKRLRYKDLIADRPAVVRE